MQPVLALLPPSLSWAGVGLLRIPASTGLRQVLQLRLLFKGHLSKVGFRIGLTLHTCNRKRQRQELKVQEQLGLLSKTLYLRRRREKNELPGAP